jgi:hypothetical protein
MKIKGSVSDLDIGVWPWYWAGTSPAPLWRDRKGGELFDVFISLGGIWWKS